MQVGVDDEDAFFATSERLVQRFEARLAEQGRPPDLASDAELVLNWKWGYADGDLAWWRTGHLDEFLLEWYPRKVSAPPDLVDVTIPSVEAFLGFLGAEGLLSSASDPVDRLQAHVRGLAEDFLAAMSDPSKFGMAKSLFAGLDTEIDLDDASSIQQAMDTFNALPFAERDRILGGPMDDMARRAGLVREFGPVVLPTDDEVAAAASAAPWVKRLLDFTEWFGDGRSLTKNTNNLTLADARELVDLLDAEEVMDEQIGDRTFRTVSSTELPTVDLAYRWARAAGLVKVRKGRLTRTALGARVRDEDPGKLARRLLWSLVDKVGILAHRWRGAAPYAWDWHAQTVDGLVPEWLLDLYDEGTLEVAELTEQAWEELEYAFDLTGQSARSLADLHGHVGDEVRRVFRVLAGLGVVTVDDVDAHEEELGPVRPDGTRYARTIEEGGTVTITSLGTWAVHGRASAFGTTTVVGELAALPATELLARLPDVPEQLAGPELDAWLAARSTDEAVASLAASLESASATGLGVAFRALLRIGAEAAPTVSALRDDPHLGPYARVWEVDALAVDVARVQTDDPAMQAGVVGAALDLWGESAPSRWVGLVVGTDEVGALAEAVATWWNLEGDAVTEVLELLGRDDRKPLAKAARKALFRRRSRSQ